MLVKRGKKGQFYLVAAMIIIAVLLGIFGVTNYIKKTDGGGMNDLQKELDIEIEMTTKYIVSNSLSDATTKGIWSNFSETHYTVYGDQASYVFLYGNETYTTVKGSLKVGTSDAFIDVGSGFVSLANGGDTFEENYAVPGGSAIIGLNGNHTFDLSKGQHFYYLISKEFKGENTIIRG